MLISRTDHKTRFYEKSGFLLLLFLLVNFLWLLFVHVCCVVLLLLLCFTTHTHTQFYCSSASLISNLLYIFSVCVNNFFTIYKTRMSDGNAFDSSDSESDTEATENTCSSCQETFLSNCKGVSVFKCLCRLCHDNYKKETLKNIANDSSDDNEEDYQLPLDVVNKSPDETVDAGRGGNFSEEITNDIDKTCNDEVMEFSHDCDAVIDAMTSVLNDRNNMKSGVVEEQDVVVDNIDDEVNNVENKACEDNVVDGIVYSISNKTINRILSQTCWRKKRMSIKH